MLGYGLDEIGLNNLFGFLQTLAIIVGGFAALSALYIYWEQERRKIINAARLVKLEIDVIEKTIDNLEGCNIKIKDNPTLDTILRFKLLLHSKPIYHNLDWFTQRHLLVSRIDADHVDKLNEFFSQVALLEEARKASKEIVFQNSFRKIQATQYSISNFLSERAKTLYTQQMNCDEQKSAYDDIARLLDAFWTLFNSHFRFCESADIDVFYENTLKDYKRISDTPAYEAIKKVARMNNK